MTVLRAFHLDDDALHLLDQRALPVEERWLELRTVAAVAEAIETLAVRGAPAIGGAAACGMVIAAREHPGGGAELIAHMHAAEVRLRTTRPTAVNLFFALDRMRERLDGCEGESVLHADVLGAMEHEARAICEEDAAMCHAMGEHGAELFEDGDRVLTICHTGALATCGQGTALGVLKAAHAQGKKIKVFALETRPLLQGARLTAWECLRLGLDVTLLTDGMAGFALKRLGITKAISGADRIAANGDTANKIGTYSLATLCAAHDVPFFVAAPTSTIDGTLAVGAEIPIEERDASEIVAPRGAVFAPADVPVWNPAFDVTPADRITAIITEGGVLRAPYALG